MSARRIEGELVAYLPIGETPEILQRSDPVKVLDALSFSSLDSMENIGWTRVGIARIVVEIVDEQRIVANKVTSLRAEKVKVVADATAKATEIERRIQSLLALPFDGGAA